MFSAAKTYPRAGAAALILVLSIIPACSKESAEAPALAAAETPEMPGQAIAQNLCAGCHAIGLDGDSPHADAPPFRTLSEKYPVRLLEEALAEGIAVGHEDMPEFQLEADEVEQLIQYLESIQAK
jgi:mono/diheme cytochrome c family protein